jgi:Tol biopolymer transport system component
VSQTGGGNASNGASFENAGVWTGNPTLIGLSVFRNMATGIVRKTGSATDSQIGSSIVNDGLIVNESGATLGLGPFPGAAPGKIAIGGLVSSGPVLAGSGRLAPVVVHKFGIVAPGFSPGTIEVTGVPGSWEVGSAVGDPPTLQIEIGGTGPGQFDKLILPGAFTLPPGFTTLALSTLPGYEPTPGDEFAIVDAGSVTGTFDTVTGTDLGNGLSFEVTYEADRIVVTVTGTPVNARPNAVDDDLTVAEDTGATPVDVLANDTDPDGDPLEIVANAQPAGGSADCTASECTYTPDPDFNGADSFTYRIADPIGNTHTATVTVDVTPVNDDPSATDDTATVDQGSVDNDVDVLANDSDLDGDARQVTAVSDPANGSAQIGAGGGSVLYTPDPPFSGADSFTYTVSDGNGGTATATVSVAVEAPETGTIEVVLDALPNDAQDFPFIVSTGGQQLEAFSLDDDADGTLPSSRLLGPLPAGAEYTVVLTGALPSGWALTAIDCGGSAGDLLAQEVTVQLEPDDAIRCTFTVGTGFIEVALDAQPDDAQDFPFAVSTGGQQVGSFSLDDDGDATLSSARLLGPTTAASDYAIVLMGQLPSGWVLTAIDCDEAPVSTNVTNREVILRLDPGDRVRCTFRVATAFVEVTLDTQPDSAQDFPFIVSRGGLEAESFSLDDDADGALSASRTVGPLEPRGDQELYFATLSPLPPGWTVTAIECNETPISGGPERAEVALALDPGDRIRCTFTVGTGFLEVALDALPDDAQDVQFEIEEIGQAGFFSLDDDADPTLPAELRSGPLEVEANGTLYRIRLDGGLQPGWRLIGISCSETPVVADLPAATVQVQLDPGETIRCTFTIGSGSLEVALDSQPDDPQDVPFVVGGIEGQGPFALDDDADPTLPASRQLGQLPAEGHRYTVTLGGGAGAGLPPNWRLTAIDCSEEPMSTDLVRQEVVVELNPGDGVRCTFVVTRITQNPVAVDDTATVEQGSADNPIDVLANDTDPDGDVLTILSNSGAAHGTVTCTATACSYTPSPGYSGPDSFTYTMFDGQGVADDGLVSITVRAAANDEILFASLRDGNMEIYVMNADGSGQRRLTTSPGVDDQPVWSPDRTKIAFRSFRNGLSDIYVMNADGSDPRRLTVDPSRAAVPDWSPDGTRIAFESGRNGPPDIYVINPDGSGVTRVTTNPTADQRPSWSPDGRRIAFDSRRGGTSDIYIVDADGSDERQLTSNPSGDVSPAWSPDGSRIAFDSRRGGNMDVYVIGADGTGETQLTTVAAVDREPAWSPDGSKIAFTSFRGGTIDIYAMNADGADQTQLTTSPAADITPAWSTPVLIPPLNGPPSGVDDFAALPEDSKGIEIDVLANDADPEGDALQIVGSTPAANGDVSCTASSCSYAPKPGFSGSDAFTYTADDGHGATDTATVAIAVTPPALMTPLGARCAGFRDGAAAGVAELVYTTLPGGQRRIVAVSPQTLRYFAAVTVSGPFTIEVTQSRSPASPTLAALAPVVPILRRFDCSPVGSVTATVSGGNVRITGSVPGPTTLILDIPYTAQPLVGRPSQNQTVTYTFEAGVDRVAVPQGSAAVVLRPR